ncbi:MAG TPA: nicotinate-nucleotide adenylyltransferase [Clostridiales bacterium]|nr:nicotinate-nucleotide adenylyltransferase [Clostridiales bacterium]
MKKIGIMGGTFNPIHFGHLFLAENAYEQLGLDRVLFIPSKNPPHKSKPEDITEQQRVDMIQLAIKGNPHFELSTIELERGGITYTADTMTILKGQNPDTDYYFIVGADSLFQMHQWYQPQVIFDNCTVAAANRDHADQEALAKQVDMLKRQFNANIILLDMPTVQVSSCDIRERVAERKSVRYYLPGEVLDYIKIQQLYSGASEDRT